MMIFGLVLRKRVWKAIVTGVFTVTLISGLAIATPSSNNKDIPMKEKVVLERGNGPVKVGMASVSIDPPQPVYIPYGQKVKVHEFSGTTYVKAVVFEVEKLKVAWVVLDVIGMRLEEMNFIKEHIAAGTGLKKTHIMLKGTHTHCYPRVRKGEILYLLAERSAMAVKEALNGLFDAKIGIGHRMLRQDLVNNRDNFDGPVFTDLFVMRIDDSKGVTRGAIFNFAAHPVIFTKSWGSDKPGMIGPDWPGIVRDYIELQTKLGKLYEVYASGNKKVPESIFTMFTQGGCGSIVGLGPFPQPIEHIDGVPVSWRETFVKTLARNVVSMLPAIETTEHIDLEFRWKTVKRPAPCDKVTPLQAFIFNEETVFSTWPGEMVAEQVVAFREHSGFKHSIILEHANDHHGYPRPMGQVIEGIAWGSRRKASDLDGDMLLNAMITLVNPNFKPFPPFDERTMGTIRGSVEYGGEQQIEIVVLNVPRPARHGASKSVVVGEDGFFKITNLLPGVKFLSVVRGQDDKEQTLINNYPVTVQEGRETVVHFHIDQAKLKTKVKAFNIKEVKVEGYRIFGRVQIEGELEQGKQVKAGLFLFAVPQPHVCHLVFNQPVQWITVDEDGVFQFDGVTAGEYRVVIWLDVNRNAFVELWGVDVISPLSNVLAVVD